MENVPKQRTRFPPTLLTAGLHDNRVCYWEPAKYAQRLREVAAEPGSILLKTDMGAGHFSFSDRYQGEREKAFELGFLLHHLVGPSA
jgi:oligopeptidase B